MGDHAQADLVAEGHAAVGIEQVGLILIDQVFDASEPLAMPARVFAVPALVIGRGRPVIQVLVLGVGAIVGNAGEGACLVGAMAVLEPGEAGTQVLGDAESQAQLLGGLLPVADDVTVRSHLHGVPFVVRGVPEVEVVVMNAHAHEVAGAGLLVHGHQPVRVPFLGLPERDDVLVTELRGMAIMFQVVLVLRMTLLIELPGVPVAEHGHGLRPPVGPDPQLRSHETSPDTDTVLSDSSVGWNGPGRSAADPAHRVGRAARPSRWRHADPERRQ